MITIIKNNFFCVNSFYRQVMWVGLKEVIFFQVWQKNEGDAHLLCFFSSLHVPSFIVICILIQF